MFSTSETEFWRQNLGNRFTLGENRSRIDFTRLSRARLLQALFLAGSWNAPDPNESEGTFTVTADLVDDQAGSVDTAN